MKLIDVLKRWSMNMTVLPSKKSMPREKGGQRLPHGGPGEKKRDNNVMCVL